MWDLWNRGGPFVGTEGRPHAVVTVEKDWQLSLDSATTPLKQPRRPTGTFVTYTPTGVPIPSTQKEIAEALKLDTAGPDGFQTGPYRWFQRADNSQTETVIPNLKSISIDRSIDTDAAGCTLEFYNTVMDPNLGGQNRRLGNPGALSPLPSRVDVTALVRWGQTDGEWNDVLVEDALVRTYQGYGGQGKPLAQALADGNLVLTGVWLVDEVGISSKSGLLELTCRDMARLLIDQPLYPPLVPSSRYPLRFAAFSESALKRGGETTDYHTVTGAMSPAPLEGRKWIADIAYSADGRGYWLVGTDGGVFTYGGVPFYGSRGFGLHADPAPMVSIAADPLNRGYWLVSAIGGVYAFGEAGYYGGGNPAGDAVVAIRAHPTGRGYWILWDSGRVGAFGRAVDHGVPAAPVGVVVDMQPTRTGNGYVIVTDQGRTYSFGDAPAVDDVPSLPGFVVAFIWRPDGGGGYLVSWDGDVTPVAVTGQPAPPALTPVGQYAKRPRTGPAADDGIRGAAIHPNSTGAVVVGGSGVVLTYGTAMDHGNLKFASTFTVRESGNISDYTDVVRELLRWSGWQLYGTGDVYGNLEMTGVFPESPLTPDVFDKKPVIEPINTIKEVVGYVFWVDEEAAARWESPNWWRLGNFFDDGTPTRFVPTIDERTQMTEYNARRTSRPKRDRIIVTTTEPTLNLADTVGTQRNVNDPSMRGMLRPSMIGVPIKVTRAEQERMAELVDVYIRRAVSTGVVTFVANPALQINDQVRLMERTARETRVHYIRGLNSNQDLDTGVWMMTATTNNLGDLTEASVEPGTGPRTVVPA